MITDRGTSRAMIGVLALAALAAVGAGCSHNSDADVYAKAFDKTATPPAGFTAWQQKKFGGGGGGAPGAPRAPGAPGAPAASAPK